MPHIMRSSDVVEIHAELAISFGVGAAVSFVISGLLIYYRGSTGMFVPLASIILLIGVACALYGIYCAFNIRTVKYILRECPFCQTMNALDGEPTEDFLCIECQRLIPLQDGQVLPVDQVRCGYCNALNYYSSKTDVLLCESCNHEIPIAHEDGHVPTKSIPSGYAVDDDDRPYELILVAHGSKTEELIECLQHMLALNRGQVKQLLTELPATLLTGIPKRKADMLRAQLSIHDGAADSRPLASDPVRQ
jgi:hypothetical protein